MKKSFPYKLNKCVKYIPGRHRPKALEYDLSFGNKPENWICVPIY